MYTVLVVDDEELICQGIKSMIERLNHPGVSKVLLAYTAAEARSVIRSSSPDIVFTDIQMPGENGLEMIQSLVSESLRIKFVVISGYDEFQYAREALKLGVLDYLLKPASIDELRDVLDNAVSVLNLEKRDSSEAKEQIYRRLLLENNLRKLFLYKSADDFDVRNILERLRPFFPHECYTLGIIRPNAGSVRRDASPAGPGEDAGGVGFRAGEGWQASELRNEAGNEVVVVNHDSDLPPREVISAIVSAVSGEEDATAGISSRGSGIESLTQLYRQAGKALSYRLLCGAAVIEFSSIRDRAADAAFTDAKLEEFAKLVKSPDEKRLSDAIDSLFSAQSLSGHSIECVERLYHGVGRQLGSLAVSGKPDAGEDAAPPFDSFGTLGDVRIHLKETAYRRIKAMKEEESEKTVMASTMNYIRDNIGNEISLAVAANRASVSYTHFSRLFKKQTGMNFSEFLMKARMEEAKRLLCDPTLRIYEIAAKVGYSDPKHFTRAFRLYYGASPAECRSGANCQALNDAR